MCSEYTDKMSAQLHTIVRYVHLELKLLISNTFSTSRFLHTPICLYSYVPDRFFVANEVDWTKYCKGLLLDNGCTSAIIGGKKAVVPMSGLPDGKDGAIVYEVSCVFS